MPRNFAHLTSTACCVLAIAVLMAACGSASRPTIETASPFGADPAPSIPVVPTTAPILLPPEDLDLPAQAPIEITLDVPPSATTPTPVAAAANDAAPQPTAPNDATPASEQPAAAPVAAAVQSVDWWNPCIVSAAQSVGASNLLDPIASATSTDLSSQQLNALAAASVDCGLVAEALSTTDLNDHLASGLSCMNQWLQSTGGGSVFAGLASVNFGQATPTWAQDYLASSITSCFVGASFAAEVLADVSADPSIVAAFDANCLATSFDSSGVMATYLATLIAAPTAADLSIGLDDAWVLNCASVGTIVASAAAAEGIALSASTVACLDAEFRSAGLVSGLINGTADSEAVGISTIACLSNEEAALILG